MKSKQNPTGSLGSGTATSLPDGTIVELVRLLARQAAREFLALRQHEMEACTNDQAE